MAERKFPLAVVVSGIDRVTGVLGGIQRSIAGFNQRVAASTGALSRRMGLDTIRKAAGNAGDAIGNLGGKVRSLVRQIGILSGAVVGLGALAVRSLTQTASQFERFQTILETLEGGQEGAQKSMAWVSEFAAKTPYELAEVMDAFVKLRAYGIDPTDGTLRTLGDTAAAMGKPVGMAVEAIADAITGENERLKEFGIKAKKQGDKIVYEYSKNGETMRRVVSASNRAMIQSTLTAIWSDRYGGAMDKLSGTWAGMMSNLSDQWERFKLLIMQAGAFEWMKARLAELLARIDSMANSGELRELARVIGERLVSAFKATWRAGQALVRAWPQIVAAVRPVIAAVTWLVNTFGAGNVVMGLVIARLALLVPAIITATTAIWGLAAAFLSTPFGWIAIGIAALAGAVFIIYRNWGKFTAWWGDLTESVSIYWLDMLENLGALWDQYNPFAMIRNGMASVMEWISNWGIGQAIRDKVASIASYLPGWLRDKLGIGDIPAAGVSGTGSGSGAISSIAGARGGDVRVTVDLNGLPPGARTSQETRGRPDFELNQGFALGGAW